MTRWWARRRKALVAAVVGAVAVALPLAGVDVDPALWAALTGVLVAAGVYTVPNAPPKDGDGE